MMGRYILSPNTSQLSMFPWKQEGSVFVFVFVFISYICILVMLGRYFLPLSPWQQEASVLRSCSFEVVGNPLLLQYSPPLHFRPPIRQSALCSPVLHCCAFNTTFCTGLHCGALWRLLHCSAPWCTTVVNSGKLLLHTQ